MRRSPAKKNSTTVDKVLSFDGSRKHADNTRYCRFL